MTEFRARAGGPLSIWRLPEAQEIYCIGGDVAEGVDLGDYSVAQVISVRTMEQVAVWRGRIAPDIFGRVLCNLGKFYGMCLVAPEVNNQGISTLDKMIALHYPRIYKRHIFDVRRKKKSKKLGWKTTSVSKPLAIGTLAEFIREGDIILNDRQTIKEAMGYQHFDDGSMGAKLGSHDDCVMSLAIAVQAAKESLWRPPKVEEFHEGTTLADAKKLAEDFGGTSLYRGKKIYKKL